MRITNKEISFVFFPVCFFFLLEKLLSLLIKPHFSHICNSIQFWCLYKCFVKFICMSTDVTAVIEMQTVYQVSKVIFWKIVFHIRNASEANKNPCLFEKLMSSNNFNEHFPQCFQFYLKTRKLVCVFTIRKTIKKPKR